MDDALLLELGPEIARHPWWQARTRLVMAILERLCVRPPARLLDVGCGWGVVLQALEQRGYEVTGMDISRAALDRLDRPGRRLVEAGLGPGFDPPAELEDFDAVLALDVIEHLDDDRAALEQVGRLVAPGGWVVVSVPARPDLWSVFDEVQGHRRRYLPETLSAAFEGTGLGLTSVQWWGAWMVPLFRRRRGHLTMKAGESACALYRRALRVPPAPLRWVIECAFAREHRLALEGRLQNGTSLFALARRPGANALTRKARVIVGRR